MTNTQGEILDAAEGLAQTVGYDGFSFRDLAERVGIRAASVHHHFPTKGDLCLAMIARHRRHLRAALEAIDARAGGPVDALRRYARLFRDTIHDSNRMCLCGMLASDVERLPPEARDELRAAFEEHESWVARALESGRSSGVLRFEGTPPARARLLVAGLEGALLVARTFADPARFSAIARDLLADLAPPR